MKVLVWRLGKIKKGDMVVLRDPRTGRIILKRVHRIRHPELVSGSQFFVLGDNLKESTDSRVFGWIKKKDIIGRVCFSLQQ